MQDRDADCMWRPSVVVCQLLCINSSQHSHLEYILLLMLLYAAVVEITSKLKLHYEEARPVNLDKLPTYATGTCISETPPRKRPQ